MNKLVKMFLSLLLITAIVCPAMASSDDLGLAYLKIQSLESQNSFQQKQLNDLALLLSLSLQGKIPSEVDSTKQKMEKGDMITFNVGDWTGNPEEEKDLIQKGILLRETKIIFEKEAATDFEVQKGDSEILYGIFNLKRGYILYKYGTENGPTSVSFNW